MPNSFRPRSRQLADLAARSSGKPTKIEPFKQLLDEIRSSVALPSESRFYREQPDWHSWEEITAYFNDLHAAFVDYDRKAAPYRLGKSLSGT